MVFGIWSIGFGFNFCISGIMRLVSGLVLNSLCTLVFVLKVSGFSSRRGVVSVSGFGNAAFRVKVGCMMVGNRGV